MVSSMGVLASQICSSVLDRCNPFAVAAGEFSQARDQRFAARAAAVGITRIPGCRWNLVAIINRSRRAECCPMWSFADESFSGSGFGCGRWRCR